MSVASASHYSQPLTPQVVEAEVWAHPFTDGETEAERPRNVSKVLQLGPCLTAHCVGHCLPG